MKKIKLDIQANSTLQDWESGLDTVDSLHSALAEDRFTDDSIIRGTLTTPVAPSSKAKALKERFSDFNIATDDSLVQFEDSEVAKVIGHNAGNGTPISKDNFSKLTSIGTWFNGNNKIREFNELEQATSITDIRNAFAYSSIESVRIGKNVVDTGGQNPDIFKGCNKLKRINSDCDGVALLWGNMFIRASSFSSITNLNKHLRYFFYPTATGLQAEKYGLRGIPNPSLMDLGKKFLYLGTGFLYQVYSAPTVVFRSIAVSEGAFHNVPSKMFVPSSSLGAYREAANWSAFADRIFAIGGEEWQAEFGSADEYADVIKYVSDHEEQQRIIEAYQNA